MPANRPGERAQDLYVARSVLDDTPGERLVLGIADLVAYLSDPTADLTEQQWRVCRENPRLKADYEKLKSRLFVAELPAAAAAAQGDLHERKFAGGFLRLRASAVPGQVYLIVTLEPTIAAPRMLLIEGKNGEVARIALPPPDADGTMLVIQDTARNEADARAIRLLRDPACCGVFLS